LQATIYTRDAVKEVEFAKGDMYVHDMGQTKGHIAALACARWHPLDRALCLTAAIDGTVRLWDVTMCDKKQVTVLKAKNTRGQKTIPHAATYRPNGDVIAACDDGTIKASAPAPFSVSLSLSPPSPPRCGDNYRSHTTLAPRDAGPTRPTRQSITAQATAFSPHTTAATSAAA
jgi:hypothetical protein